MSIDEQYEKRKKDIKDGAQIIVYEENKKVKGFAWYGSGRINKNEYDDSIFELYAIYVEPKEKGRGIGTKLLNIAKKEGTKRHYNRMLLWCLRDNIAGRKFYIKNGGRIINIKKTEIGNIEYEEVCFEFDL
jgi:GNAT superfamily N-acetyltransferase